MEGVGASLFVPGDEDPAKHKILQHKIKHMTSVKEMVQARSDLIQQHPHLAADGNPPGEHANSHLEGQLSISVRSAADVSLGDRQQAAEGLLRRVVGEKSAEDFAVQVVEKLPDTQEYFEIKSLESSKILLRGTSGVAVASALNWYLRYEALVDTSWNTPFPVSLPSPPPAPKAPTRRKAMVKWGYYENVCTHSYSQAWWQWPRWEREIDWMAMSGINLPLAITGQEYVLHAVFEKLGISEDVMQTFFTGPAFLAWNRMLNIKQWAGPLTPSWLTGQRDLQIRILQRERSLGMTPVLPAFAGGVPDEFSGTPRPRAPAPPRPPPPGSGRESRLRGPPGCRGAAAARAT